MKKFLAILVALALICSVFLVAGCKKKEEAKVVVKTMAYGDNANPEGVNWLRIVAAFEEKNPNIDIDFEMLYDEAYHQKVVARLAAGDVPHLAYMGADARWGVPWLEADQRYDHRPYIDADTYDLDLIPPMARTARNTIFRWGPPTSPPCCT